MRLGNRQNQQEIEKNRATPHHENDPESALPKAKKPNDHNEISKYDGSLPTRASGCNFRIGRKINEEK